MDWTCAALRLAAVSTFLGLAGWLLVAGVLLFSGSLDALALTGNRGWGAVTPFGGVAFLVGWLALLIEIPTM
jgi:uncharacterized membrane protein YgdD (TMEM256/DUF423 family)